MSKSDAQRFAEYLQTSGLGTLGTDLFYDELPPVGGATVAVITTGGPNPWPDIKIDFPTIQVLVRSGIGAVNANHDKALTVKNLLLGVDPLTLDGVVYKSVIMLGDINFLGFDANRQPIRSLNFRLIKENEPGGNRTDI